MASRSRRVTTSLDSNNPANCTTLQLKEALKNIVINVTINLSHNNLKKLYLDNLKREHNFEENAPTIDNFRQSEVTQNARNSGSSGQSDLLQAHERLSSQEANLG